MCCNTFGRRRFAKCKNLELDCKATNRKFGKFNAKLSEATTAKPLR